jgi:Flp pilus assembly protein TadG
MLNKYRCYQISGDERGATAVEFALVASSFFMLMFGIIEYGMIQFTKVAIESATIQMSRNSSIGSVTAGCADRVCEVKKLVQQKTQGLVRPESVSVTATVISNPTTLTPAKPDICLANPAVPYPVTCVGSYVENSGNPIAYDPPPALTNASIGNAGDLVELRVTYLWRVLFPMFTSYFGTNGVLTISASTVIKNEPF